MSNIGIFGAGCAVHGWTPSRYPSLYEKLLKSATTGPTEPNDLEWCEFRGNDNLLYHQDRPQFSNPYLPHLLKYGPYTKERFAHLRYIGFSEGAD